MSIAPSPTFSAIVWLAGTAAVTAAIATIALELVGTAAAAVVVLAMVFVSLTVAGRRYSS